MNYTNIFKPAENISEEEIEKLAVNIRLAFPYIELTYQKRDGKIVALKGNFEIIFKRRKADGKK